MTDTTITPAGAFLAGSSAGVRYLISMDGQSSRKISEHDWGVFVAAGLEILEVSDDFIHGTR